VLIDPTGIVLSLRQFVGVNSSKMTVRGLEKVRALEEEQTK
jgi:hypothetical protein